MKTQRLLVAVIVSVSPLLLPSTASANPWSAPSILVRCGGDPSWQPLATIIGTTGSDTLVGTPGDDVIAGLGGNDTIIGNGGNDIICGGTGNDVIYAGTQQWWDGVNTQPGAGSTIYGQGGSDVIYGSAFDDVLVGGAGSDSLYGLGGADQLFGGNDVDVLAGGMGADYVRGENGNDWHFGNWSPGGFFPLYSCEYLLCADDGSPDTLIDDVDDNVVIEYDDGDNADILWVTTTMCDVSTGSLQSADAGDQVYCGWP
jgi:Ca2+-binding RTX toxin-like protein